MRPIKSLLLLASVYAVLTILCEIGNALLLDQWDRDRGSLFGAIVHSVFVLTPFVTGIVAFGVAVVYWLFGRTPRVREIPSRVQQRWVLIAASLPILLGMVWNLWDQYASRHSLDRLSINWIWPILMFGPAAIVFLGIASSRWPLRRIGNSRAA